MTSRTQTVKLGISKELQQNHRDIFPLDEMIQDKDQIKCVLLPPIVQTSSGTYYNVDREMH